MTKPVHHTLPDGFQVIERLGQGGEGTIYLVSRRGSARQLVVKVFHEPLPKAWAIGLQVYAEEVSSNDLGLPQITLWDTAQGIRGVYYPFTGLYRTHRRLVTGFRHIARSMLGSFCRMQSYLMSKHRIGLLEPMPEHLLLSREGSFFYVDFGYGVSTLDHSETRRLNLFGFGFAAFLAVLHGRNFRLVQQAVAGHNYDQPCTYFAPDLLDGLIPSDSWVSPIIARIRTAPAEILLEADFYRALSSQLPHRLESPGLAIAAGHLLRMLGTLRHTVRGGATR